MREASRKYGVTLIGGTIAELDEQTDEIKNTCLVFSARGDLLGKYSKTHLFDIDIPGQISYRESDVLTRGPGLVALDIDVEENKMTTKTSTAEDESQPPLSLKVGLGICYDLRFPELAMAYASKGCQLLCFPGAFNMVTGPLHWELLQRARAVDNQLFVASACCARDTSASYVAYGHSMVVGPFGEVLQQADGGEAGEVVVEIDLTQVQTRRTNMPLTLQKRTDLYRLVCED